MVLLVAEAYSGRSKLSKKQATLVGFGSAFKSATASSIVRGEPLTPAGGWQVVAAGRPAAPPMSDCGAALQANKSMTLGSK